MVSLLALRAQWLAKTYAPNKKKDNNFFTNALFFGNVQLLLTLKLGRLVQ